MMNCSNAIIQIRSELNLTQNELSKKIGVSFATINRWENGKTVPSKRHMYLLVKICKENNVVFPEVSYGKE